MSEETVLVDRQGPVTIVTINRPAVRNAVDGPTAELLYQAFQQFEDDTEALVAVLEGTAGTFCAGADLKAVAAGIGNRINEDDAAEIVNSIGPMGPSRMQLSKPVIAAVEGFAVAGGLELAVWCDLRVCAEDASFGVFCRRWGVPLVDGGTVRLPRLIGHSHAMDMILTGREVGAVEAQQIGLANRVVPTGTARQAAIALAQDLAGLPQNCLRSDRRSAIEQWSMDPAESLAHEVVLGMATIRTGETVEGAARFRDGAGRHGASAS